ncbi:MAG: bifunctional oligoribonuclease/PAP phosphatase NrnA [Sedimentisphaerales bacterium]|jgi:phosphoesterase RecJ-like protein
MDNQNFKNAVDLINKSANMLITTHSKADGDAVGCCVAMSETLSALDKKAQILFLSQLPDWYSFLVEKPVPVLGKDLSKDQLAQNKFDLIVIVDTNSSSQLPGFEEYLKQADAPVLVIDHHPTSDGLGDVEIVDSTAAAASSLVLDLFRFAHWPIIPKIAQALFAGIATDTGWFHFNNTTSRCLRDCADLIDAGANPADIYRLIYQTFTPQRFKLMTAMQDTLELHFDGRYASQFITLKDFHATGAKHEDTENLIDQCQRIGSVVVAALFVELKDGRIRCSLRSRGDVDVCKIARRFDGGGHTSAAGAYLSGPLDNAKKLILDAVKSSLNI